VEGPQADHENSRGRPRHSFQPVFVKDAAGTPLAPCTPARARQILREGKAEVVERCPFEIRLSRVVANSAVAPVDVKLDTGSSQVGFALLDETGRVYLMGELSLRTDIKKRMDWRRERRRSRRSRKTRYRVKRFDNRRRRKGWLPPSLRSRVEATARLAARLACLLPVRRIVAETATFDVHRLVNPDVKGEAYQRGPLYRTDLRKWLFEKSGGVCTYCSGPLGAGWQADHIVPRSRGGSDRPFNRTAACRECNLAKANMTAEKFGHPEVVPAHGLNLAPPTIMNSIRQALVAALSRIAPVVETDGALTSFNRRWVGMAKSHANDAVCALDLPDRLVMPDMEMVVVARPRGTRRLVNGLRGERAIRLPREVMGFRQWDAVRWNGRLCYVKARRRTGWFKLSDLERNIVKDAVGAGRLRLTRHVSGLQGEMRRRRFLP